MERKDLKANAYYVLREGTIDGSFTEEELRTKLAEGALTDRDFVQIEGNAHWQPLRSVLGPDESLLEGAVAPSWREILAWSWIRLRYDCEEQALIAGGCFLAIGAIAMAVVLRQWAMIFWLPWFAAAAFLGVVLLKRNRAEQALALLAAVVILPFLLFFAIPERRPPAAQLQKAPIALAEAPMPKSEPVPVAVVPQIQGSRTVSPPALPDAPEPPPEIPMAVESAASFLATVPVSQPAAKAVPAPPPPLVETKPSPKTAAVTVPASSVASIKTAATPPAPPSAGAIDAAALIQRHRESFVVINSRSGSGSGFICRVEGKPFLFTNIHVIAGATQPEFTRLDGTSLHPGSAGAAVGHDIMRFELTEPVTQPLEAMADPGNNLRMGDEVIVLGNSGGGGVVTSLPGEIVGIGPDRIEVSAAFIPGNSGSPIIHVRTGMVIGVATYLTSRRDEFQSNASKYNAPLVVRRFGYRLDSVRQWEPVTWAAFRQDSEELRKISAVTEDVIDFLAAVRERRDPSFNTATLERSANEWFNKIRNKRTSEADRRQSTIGFLRSLRSIVRSDVAAAEGRVRYAYFRDDLRKEREVRDRLYDAFNAEAQKLASPR